MIKKWWYNISFGSFLPLFCGFYSPSLIFYCFGELLTENEKERFDLLARRLKLDKSCSLKRKPLISVCDTIGRKQKGIGLSSPWHFGKAEEEGKKKGQRRPSNQRDKRWSRSCAQVYELLSFHQANWAFVFPRPKSQMVFGAFGTLQSQRLKKLSAVFMEAERRSRQQHFTAVIPHFKAAFNVVSVLLQRLCPSGSDLLGRAVIRPIKWD